MNGASPKLRAVELRMVQDPETGLILLLSFLAPKAALLEINNSAQAEEF